MKIQSELTEKQFIEYQVSKLKNGFGSEQIIKETWHWALTRWHWGLQLESIIENAMMLYSQITMEYQMSVFNNIKTKL
jgi:hypothetical protein